MSSESADRVDQGAQFLLESCVLRTLCLTVNSDGSQLKYRILDTLTEEDFYFPVMREVFRAVSEMHRDGDQVVARSLQEMLAERWVDIPADFYLEDLFRGDLPSMATLSGWIDRLCARATDPPGPVPPPPRPAGPVAIHSVPPVPVPAAPVPPPPPLPEPEASFDRAPIAGEPGSDPPFDSSVLSPESGEWLGFLADLTKKQGFHLKTGFAGLDAASGGLAPGLFLLAGEDLEELADFLKQLVDQVAVACKGPCLYLSFERTKPTLRLQTLARLSDASTEDIEKGRFAKDSAKWQDIVRAGEHAVDWLQRIYVVEVRPGLSVTRIRELRQGLLDAGAGAPLVIAVDNLEKLANESDLLHSVAELKELAESFGIVVVGGVTTMELVHERSADLAASFHREEGVTAVRLLTSGSRTPVVLRFEHRRDLHRFVEL